MGPSRALCLSCAAVAVVAVMSCRRPIAKPLPPVPTCPPRTVAIQGACLDPDEAKDYCGKGAEPEAGGCALSHCELGEAVDLSTGVCSPARTLRRLAASRHVDLHDDTMLGCANPEASFVLDGSAVACVARVSACGRGAQWANGACRPDLACPPGSVLDTTKSDAGPDVAASCVSVVHGDGKDAVLDVGTWVRLVLGPDGAEGTPAVCGPLALRPASVGLVAHGRVTVELHVRLVFPDNEVAALDPQVTVYRRGDPHAEDGQAPGSLGDELLPLWKSLRLIGGVSSASSVTTTVHCPIESGAAPTAVPRAGPLPEPADAGANAKGGHD